jgi:hypothetical protein
VGITPIVQRAVEIVENGTQNIVSNYSKFSLGAKVNLLPGDKER